MKHDIKVNQELFFKRYESERGAKYEIIPVTVVKVGRLYFEVKDANDSWRFHKTKFSFEDLIYHDKQYSQHNMKLYLSVQEIADEQEYSELSTSVGRQFGGYYFKEKVKLNLDQLRRIQAIINEGKEINSAESLT